MNKYTISIGLFSFFSVTTTVILILAHSGAFVGMVGSIDAAFTVYGINTAMLIVSLLFYIYQRSQHNLAAKKKSAILDAYAKRAQPNEEKPTDTDSTRDL
ncbi:MAG: hypothetical protein ACTJG2_03060 [Candidatus Saccharimonadales bacterium]